MILMMMGCYFSSRKLSLSMVCCSYLLSLTLISIFDISVFCAFKFVRFLLFWSVSLSSTFCLGGTPVLNVINLFMFLFFCKTRTQFLAKVREVGGGQQLLNGMTVQEFTETSAVLTERSSQANMPQDWNQMATFLKRLRYSVRGKRERGGEMVYVHSSHFLFYSASQELGQSNQKRMNTTRF